MKNTVYQITEFGSFNTGTEKPGYTLLPETTFAQLEDFILSNRNRSADAVELMGFSARKGVGKVITAKNYVGIISMKDGVTIEILPKICSKTETDTGRVKRLVIDMLKTLRNAPYKSLQTANIDVERMSIFEVFIRMFLDEVFLIVKRGIKSGYETVTSNEAVCKGKILFSQQVIHNYAHKERTYVAYDEFDANRPENRLIKSTLLYLYRRTNLTKSKNDIRVLLGAFNEAEPSADIAKDFSACIPDRNMKDYERVLLWCGIFLMGKSFTSFAGSSVAFALLFPMETLYESFIAARLRSVLDPHVFSMTAQDKTYHLFDFPGKSFLMKPDIAIKRKADGAFFICDTKWKVLSEDVPHYGISQADMYQMYAYQKKYSAKNITLLYPMTDKVSKQNIEYRSDDGTVVRVRFIDLFNLKESLDGLVREFALA